MESLDERQRALTLWLKNIAPTDSIRLVPIEGAASFRRYFRVFIRNKTYIAMDAPPQHENCAPYIAIAQALKRIDVPVPEIFIEDLNQGFLLLSDLGNATYLRSLNAQNADALYGRALKTLANLQSCRKVDNWNLPLFNDAWMWQEWDWFKEWFLGHLLQLTLPLPWLQAVESCFSLIVESAINQPQVFMHRDYHSGNLMVLPGDRVGVLDFQDAFIGPVTYDLASLLRDCYITWPEERVKAWAIAYWQHLKNLGVLTHESQRNFLRWFDWMGIQRHFKALFTFSRKYVRDQQPEYLQHIPRTLQYIIKVSERYPETIVFHDYLHGIVQPAFQEAFPPCAR